MMAFQDNLFQNPLTMRDFMNTIGDCDSRALMFLATKDGYVAVDHVEAVSKGIIVLHAAPKGEGRTNL